MSQTRPDDVQETPVKLLEKAEKALEIANYSFLLADNALNDINAKIKAKEDQAATIAAKASAEQAKIIQDVILELESLDSKQDGIEGNILNYSSVLKEDLTKAQIKIINDAMKATTVLINLVRVLKSQLKELQDPKLSAAVKSDSLARIDLVGYGEATQEARKANALAMAELGKVKKAYDLKHPRNEAELQTLKDDLDLEITLATQVSTQFQESATKAKSEFDASTAETKGEKEKAL